MNVSGLLIMTDPERHETALESLREVPGLIIHEVLPDKRIVAVLERENTGEEVKTVKDLHGIDGVLSAVMVYHHFEDETADRSKTGRAGNE